ncbi:MAG: VanZ family protein [Anaerovoracaceae bacterium]|jgi:VanZ family protein
MKKKLGMIIFILLLLWIGVIFYYSSQPPGISNNQSKMAVNKISIVNEVLGFTDTKIYTKVESIVKDKWSFKQEKSPNAVVRKSAHFGIYFLLGIITASFGYVYSKKIFMAFLLGISLPVTIAVLDEYNQGLVGRTSSLNDVIIDGTGAFAGTLVVVLIILLFVLLKKR